MWRLLDLRFRIALILFTAGVIAALLEAAGYGPSSADTPLGKLSLFLAPLSFLVGVGAFGYWRATWIYPCRWGLKYWFPDLNGTWTGTFTSTHHTKDPKTPKKTSIRIEQGWVHVKIFNDGVGGISESRSILVCPAKENSEPCLFSIYRGTPIKPTETDTESYFGASQLVYNRHTKVLRVTYWTNRAWMRGGNTAGIAELRRAES